MNWKPYLILFVLIGNACAVEQMLVEKWEYATREKPNNIFALNVDGNPAKEIIVDAERSGKIIAIDRAGNEKWHYNLRGVISDLYVSEFPEGGGEVIGCAFSRVYLLNDDGSRKWEYNTMEKEVASVYLSDLDSDGKGEVVFGSAHARGNKLYILDDDGESFAVRRFTRYMYPSTIASADFDGDAREEVVVGFAGYSMNTLAQNFELGYIKSSSVVAYDLNGDELWSFPTIGGVKSMVIADVVGDEKMEVVIGSNKRIYLVDDRGVLLWDYGTGDLVYDIAVADVDGDGRKEVVAGSDKVYVLKDDGGLSWVSPRHTGVYGVEVADLDGDEIPDVIAGTTKILIYDGSGKVMWSSNDLNDITDLKASDLDSDGYFEVFASTEDGKVVYFESVQYGKGKNADHWLSSARTAYNTKEYDEAVANALKARLLFQELAQATKMNEAQDVADKARDHKAADIYLSKAIEAFESEDYDESRVLAENASTIYNKLKDAIPLAQALKLGHRSGLKPQTDANYTKALEYKELGNFSEASTHARTALSGYTELNLTEAVVETEGLIVDLEMLIEAEEYYDRAEEAYVEKKFSEASVLLDKSGEICQELEYDECLNRVNELEGKISETNTVKRVALVGGVGIVILVLTGIVLALIVTFLSLKKKNRI
ncbi:MAG: FG-GAP-like repeat-containing protein [Methanobacteriota archaeon]